MPVSLVRPWWPMIRIYLLYRVVTLPFILRTFYLLIAYAILTASANALTEDISNNTCENGGFENIYFLVDMNNFVSVSDFYQEIPAIEAKAGIDFTSYIGQRNRISIYYDFEDLDILKANKELVSILDDGLPNYFIEREQVIYIDRLTAFENTKKFEIKNTTKNILH